MLQQSDADQQKDKSKGLRLKLTAESGLSLISALLLSQYLVNFLCKTNSMHADTFSTWAETQITASVVQKSCNMFASASMCVLNE